MIELQSYPGKYAVLIQSGSRWLLFQNPIRVITANRPEDVIACLRMIGELVETDGKYAAGFISYEAAPALDPYIKTHPPDDFPLLWFGIYENSSTSTLPSFSSKITNLSWHNSVERIEYGRKIERIKEYIARGETYQTNFTFRLYSDFRSNAFDLFLALNKAQQAEYGAFLDIGKYVICSASPELLFFQNGEDIRCRPMKGTAPRGRSAVEDKASIKWLKNSQKNQAENLMIVDMIRNDLGRIAWKGSIRVDNLFKIEQYPTVFQMTSSVSAKTSAPFPQIVSALFPCASVTGTPRIRTMEIISELENTPRRVYTGSIGYIFPGKKIQFNVAIRTALIDRQRHIVEYGVGGGIVWDSIIEDEYEECLIKTRVLSVESPTFSLLETFLWTPEEGYFLLDRHLKRLADSAVYFNFPVSIERIREVLISSQNHRPKIRHRVRLLVSRNGKISLEEKILSIPPLLSPVRIKLATSPIDSNNPFLYHKTTHREVYETARASCSDCDDVLLWNERGEITETSIANFILERNGISVTPPVSSGLLPGTLRSEMLERGEIREEIIPVEEVKKYDKIYLINAVQGIREAVLIK